MINQGYNNVSVKHAFNVPGPIGKHLPPVLLLKKAGVPSLAGGTYATAVLVTTPWTEARQAPLSIALPQYRSGLPFPSLGDLPRPRDRTLHLQYWKVELPLEPPGKPGGSYALAQSPGPKVRAPAGLSVGIETL